MKSLSIITVSCFLSVVATGADAQTAKTRQQVNEEVVAAERAGDILATGETALTLRQVSPGRYPAPPASAGATRAEVASESREALRTGNVVAFGEAGLILRDEFPHRYPAVPMIAPEPRSQVRAELATAIRNGDVLPAGEGSLTLRERNPELFAMALALGGNASRDVAGRTTATR